MDTQAYVRPVIAKRIDATPFIDTHEHLIEESRRLAGPAADFGLFPCDDWAYLFVHYALNDLEVAGMTGAEVKTFTSMNASPMDKWRLFQPYWQHIRHTGYGRAVLLSIQRLFGEDDVNANTVQRITDKMRAATRKGFYRHVLCDVANIELCQVNSLEHTFCETEYPDLLYQDISTFALSSGPDLEGLRHDTGMPVTNLHECYQAIDWYFESYGQQAVAVKNQSAYTRRLNYEQVSQEDAAPLFERFARSKDELNAAETKALQDHLWRYSVSKATNYGLPVKLHTGYYAGTGSMPIERVKQNLADLCPILQDFPDTKFVLMHIAYPYQDELIAVAKQYPNVYVDLCWAWIVNPAASIRFVKEFLTAVPANKLFTFGGDYFSVETVVGHAEIARRGLAQALSELVDEGWLSEAEALALVDPLMRGNAWDAFRMAEKSRYAQRLVSQQQ
jgi:predicted TIM-barrel fold metal-dependent hydrolase